MDALISQIKQFWQGTAYPEENPADCTESTRIID